MLNDYTKIGVIYYNKENNSQIFEIQEKQTGDKYALKLVGPLDDNLKNIIFTRETNALKKLNKYNNIVTLYNSEIAFNKTNSKRYGVLLLELVQGKSLDKINKADIGDIDKYKISIGIIEAVINAHDNDIIHRDIKPSNIMVNGTDVKIIDFGISKIKSCIDEGTVKDFKSKDYCSPEVALRGDATEVSDIYSIGAVIYNLFIDKKPPLPQFFEEEIDKTELRNDLKEILISMVKEKKEEREADLEKIKNKFIAIIKKINLSENKYYFNLSLDLFGKLKRNLIIRKSMNFNEFIKSVLPKEFKNFFALINKDEYEFLGENYRLKCLYKNDIFHIFDLGTILEQEKIRFKKKALNVDGKVYFNEEKIVKNDNNKLNILISNHMDEYNSEANRNNMFYEYFKTWRNYLLESIEHEKVCGLSFTYSEFKVNENIITIKINKFINGSIDDIKEGTKFIIQQTVDEKEILTRIGTFESCEYNKGHTVINIKINKKESATKIRNLLSLKIPIKENYIYKIIGYQRQLKAINILQDDNYECKNLKDIILDIKKPRTINELKKIKFKSETINEFQQEAVRKFSSSESIALIQGPPGTGKTTVINEVIYQILKKGMEEKIKPKILVVSQSHPAVDNILEGLLKNNINVKIFRVGSEKNISDEINNKFTLEILKKKFINDVTIKCKEYSNSFSEVNLDLDENKKIKDILDIQNEWLERITSTNDIEHEIISDSEIVAGTCVGFISNPIIKEMLFDYVIIDEAAKATTPELLVSIIKAKKILLVGDHKQLPPYIDENKFDWVNKKILKELKTSLFTNLYGILPETHKEFLGRQYRMHPNIGDLISTVFYDDEVSSGVSEEQKQHNIKDLKGYSIVWYDTSKMGEKRKQRITSGKSFVNKCESEIIKAFIKKQSKLIDEERISVGIITAYSAQKDFISRSIRNYNLNNTIDVNTVDAFQGREKDVIIYSTVRSSDKDYSIGFQKEEQRINVAFSRAKKLLIIVGDINMYSRWGEKDNKFPEIVSYIKENPEECHIIDCSKEN